MVHELDESVEGKVSVHHDMLDIVFVNHFPVWIQSCVVLAYDPDCDRSQLEKALHWKIRPAPKKYRHVFNYRLPHS